MDNILKKISASVANRQYRKVVAFAVAGVIIGVTLSLLSNYLREEQVKPLPVVEEEVSATTTARFARSAPVRLTIPKIELDVTFERPLGLNEDMTIEVPDSYTKVGWYKNGPTPGEVGPAVVLGHVDSYEGPAVFWPLRQLNEGDMVEIEREDGSVAVFEVTSVVQYSQDDFPTEKVYGATDASELRLITCTGTFDKGVQRYSHNLVVYAKLVE